MGDSSLKIDRFLSKQLMELDACTRCNECLNWCPVYEEIKEDRFNPLDRPLTEEEKLNFAPNYRIQNLRKKVNDSYGLRSMLFGPKDPSKEWLESYKIQSYMCTTCGICKTVCESGIDTVELWEATRANLVDMGMGPYGKQAGFLEMIKSGNVFNAPQSDRLCWLPSDIEPRENAEVAYFVGCTAAFRMQKVAVATVRVLDELGVPFTLLGEDEYCCGSVFIRTGQIAPPSPVAEMVKKNIEGLKKRGVKKVVYACAGCVRTSALDWPKIYGGKLPFEVLTLAEYLTDLHNEGYDFNFKKPIPERVTYHDPCHSGRHMGVYDAPRQLIQSIPGLELVEMKRSRELQRCCGAGGGIKAGAPDLAISMAQKRVQDAIETGATSLLSTCPFCRRNLKDGIKAMNSSMKMEDVMVYLAEAMGLDTKVPENPYSDKQL
ncbi:MAG: (Fe-S)-binding protein [Methermicoccaceae archaeon]